MVGGEGGDDDEQETVVVVELTIFITESLMS